MMVILDIPKIIVKNNKLLKSGGKPLNWYDLLINRGYLNIYNNLCGKDLYGVDAIYRSDGDKIYLTGGDDSLNISNVDMLNIDESDNNVCKIIDDDGSLIYEKNCVNKELCEYIGYQYSQSLLIDHIIKLSIFKEYKTKDMLLLFMDTILDSMNGSNDYVRIYYEKPKIMDVDTNIFSKIIGFRVSQTDIDIIQLLLTTLLPKKINNKYVDDDKLSMVQNIKISHQPVE